MADGAQGAKHHRAARCDVADGAQGAKHHRAARCDVADGAQGANHHAGAGCDVADGAQGAKHHAGAGCDVQRRPPYSATATTTPASAARAAEVTQNRPRRLAPENPGPMTGAHSAVARSFDDDPSSIAVPTVIAAAPTPQLANDSAV